MHTLPIEKLLEAIGDARLVLLGEASHGTHEFYRIRAELTQALIRSRGFTTHAGSVTAARDWGDPAERRRVRPSLDGSWERLLHDTGLKRFLLLEAWARDEADLPETYPSGV